MGYSGAERYALRSQLLSKGIAASRYLKEPTPKFNFDKSKVATNNPTYQQMQSLLQKEAQAASNYPGKVAIFYGDSIIQSAEEYKASHLLSFNQGISGDTSGGILQRLDLGQNFMAKASEIVLGGGINDLKLNRSEATIEKIVNNKKASVKLLQEKSPQAQITVLSVLPTDHTKTNIPPNLIKKLNERLKAEFSSMPNVVFADFTQKFEEPQKQGALRPELTTDGLHLSSKGYKLFYEVLNKSQRASKDKFESSIELARSIANFKPFQEAINSSPYLPLVYYPLKKLLDEGSHKN